MVPLAWAWRHGAHGWPERRRLDFANDPLNLWPVEAGLNRSKGAQGPDTWLPPAGACGYTARFKRLVSRYQLALTPPEQQAIDRIVRDCRNGNR